MNYCLEVNDYLKVANILVLYLMVLGFNQVKVRVVENWVWVLVED